MFNNKLLMEETENSNLIKKDENKIKQKKIPIWHEQQELILKNWSEIGSS